MAMGEVSLGWSRVHPPVFLWSAVVLSPAVMGMADEGPPGRLAMAALGLVLALGFLEVVPRQGRLPSILVAVLYMVLAAALAGPPLGAMEAAFTTGALLSGVVCAALCAGLARLDLLGRVAPLVSFAVSVVFLFAVGLGPQFAEMASLWEQTLGHALCLGALAALVHGQMLAVARAAVRTDGQRIWVVELLSLLVGAGLVILLAAVAKGWSEPVSLAVSLMLAATALHRDIAPRVIAVAAVLYLAAHSEPLAGLGLSQTTAFVTLLFLALAPLRSLGRSGFVAPEEPLWFTTLQPAAEAWMVTFDLGREEVQLGPAAAAHFGVKQRLAVWLEQLSAEEGARFLALLRGRESGPIMLTLRGGGARAAPAPYAVHLLERDGARSRVLLRRMSAEVALKAKIAAQQAEIDRIRLREERLLALASHELRTPAATLSMLAEELDAGEPWEELGPDLQAAVRQVLAVLDDLRAGAKTEGALARAGEISPEQIAAWLREEFAPLAETLGVQLQLEIPTLEGLRARCEAGRLLLVLEKLLRHALSLQDLRRLRLALVTMPQGGEKMSFVWTLQPIADAPLPMPEPEIFEPFATGPEAGLGSDLKGVGLYTAEKAAQAMGGTLKLQKETTGFLFVFTHPVRRLSERRLVERG